VEKGEIFLRYYQQNNALLFPNSQFQSMKAGLASLRKDLRNHYRTNAKLALALAIVAPLTLNKRCQPCMKAWRSTIKEKINLPPLQPKHTRALTVAGGVDLSFLDSTYIFVVT